MALIIAFVFLFPSLSFALTVNLLDCSYTYDLREAIHDGSGNVVTGTGSSSGPFEAKVSIDPLYGYVAAESFSLYSESWSQDFITESPYEITGDGHAFISGTWLFSPTEYGSGITFSGVQDAWTAKYFMLTDITTGTIICDFAIIGMINPLDYVGSLWEGATTKDFAISETINIETEFFTDHIYELKMGVIAQSGADYGTALASVDLYAVPEPSTGLLILAGLFQLLFSKHKSKLNKS